MQASAMTLTMTANAKSAPPSVTTPSLVPVPEMVFVVPYRNREEHKTFFTVYMKFLMEDVAPEKYRIYFVAWRTL